MSRSNHSDRAHQTAGTIIGEFIPIWMVIVGISATGWQLLAGNVSAHAIVIRLLVKSQAQQLSVQHR